MVVTVIIFLLFESSILVGTQGVFSSQQTTGEIRIEDLKSYDPIYQCYHEKHRCLYCNKLSNIFCETCNENVCLCVNHWQNHKIEKH